MLTSVDETLRLQSSLARLVGRTCRGAGLGAHRQGGEGLFRPMVLLKEQRRFPPNTQGSLLVSHQPEWIVWRREPKPSAFKGSGPTSSFAVDFHAPGVPWSIWPLVALPGGDPWHHRSPN